MLSLHTNSAILAAQSAIGRNGKNLSQSQTRLGTGYRVNSAMDDAAGLQIATRLGAQSNGMAAAMRNTQNAVSMMQTADGALGEVGVMLKRAVALATQAADGSSSQAERDALHSEYVKLSEQIMQTMNETPYAGEPLMRYTVDTPGTMGKGAMTFQVGAASGETLTADFRPDLGRLNEALYYAIDNGNLVGMPQDGAGTELTSAESANAVLDKLARAVDMTSALRSHLGATSNELQSSYNNLASMQTNTTIAEGRIMDVDFAAESAEMTQSQMLAQAGTGMLKQSNSVAQLVMSLIQ